MLWLPWVIPDEATPWFQWPQGCRHFNSSLSLLESQRAGVSVSCSQRAASVDLLPVGTLIIQMAFGHFQSEAKHPVLTAFTWEGGTVQPMPCRCVFAY